MARDTENVITGDQGELRVMAEFAELGWAPVPTRRDLGTDLFVQVRDARRFDAGLFVGAQAKSGSSWFEQPETDDAGEITGWWFYEKDVEHFDAWVTHGLPHLVVLYHPDHKVAYWVHVTADKIVPTGAGAKILVPITQKLEEASRDALVDAAASQRQQVPLEGSIWTRSNSVPLGALMRYAMIAPRLIVPHRNAGISEVITAEEALALLMRARIEDLDQYRARGLAPRPGDSSAKARTWMWRFVAAVEAVLMGEGLEQLASLRRTARRRDRRAAAEIFYAAMLMQVEYFDEAVDELEQAPADSWEPIDYAWSRVILAAAQSEVGRIAEARTAASEALQGVRGRPDDPTASAIRGAAASLLFYTASIIEEDLGGMLSASDTAVSWWRSQTIMGGVTDSARRSYKRHFHDTATRFGGSRNPGHNPIVSASITALLAGDWSAYRASTAEQGINHIVGSDDWRTESVASLDCLRRAGLRKEVDLQADHIWRWEDLQILSEATARFEGRPYSHSSASGTLALLESSGDILESGRADGLIDELVSILEDREPFMRRVAPSFSIGTYVPRAVAGLVRSCSPENRHRVARFLCDLPNLQDGSLAYEVPRIVSRIIGDPSTSELVDSLLECGLRQENRRLSALLLESAMAGGSDQAREALLDRATSGDQDALGSLGDVRKLPHSAAARMADRSAQVLEKVISDAEGGSRSQYANDPAHLLALLSCWFPETANWRVLLRYLSSSGVSGGDKRNACFVLSRLERQLPADVRSELSELAPSISGSGLDLLSPAGLGGAGIYLAVSLGVVEEEVIAPHLMRLLSGSKQERADATLVVGTLKRPEFQVLPAGLLHDADPNVRSAAATTLAIELASPESRETPFLMEALRMAIRSDGCQLPLRIANAFYQVEVASGTFAAELVSQLSTHRSALVRSRAKATHISDG